MKASQDTHILVLSTNIDNAQKVALVCAELENLESVHSATVDLEDWENVLRVECQVVIQARDIEERIAQLGFLCTEMVH